MRLAKKEKKKIVWKSVRTRPEQENFEENSKKIKKNQKTTFRHYFLPKRDEIGQEREKKNLVPNSVHTRPRQEYSEKNSKKIQNYKKTLSSIIYSQNGMR